METSAKAARALPALCLSGKVRGGADWTEALQYKFTVYLEQSLKDAEEKPWM